MSLKTSANRYARALFDVALQEADIVQVDRDLSTAVDVMREHANALQAVTRHGVPDAIRRSVIEAIAEKMDMATPVRKILAVLAEGHRLELLPDLAAAYHERLLAHQNIVRAEVASAAPLSNESTKALEASLAKVTGKQVDLSVTVDPDLLGGLVARIGSTVYDGSVRTQLKKIRQALVD